VQFIFSFLTLTAVLAACGGDPSEIGLENPMSAENTDEQAPDEQTPDEQAPDQFTALFTTSAGEFKIQVARNWAPHGADRFYALVTQGYYDQQRFFRVVPGFVVQWGMSGDPELTSEWQRKRIPDDEVAQSNTRGRVTFAATSLPGSRTTQLFVNLRDNTNLDGKGFAPFGEVVEGMEIVDSINAEYREAPDQGEIGLRGNEYLNDHFPNLDHIITAKIAD